MRHRTSTAHHTRSLPGIGLDRAVRAGLWAGYLLLHPQVAEGRHGLQAALRFPHLPHQLGGSEPAMDLPENSKQRHGQFHDLFVAVETKWRGFRQLADTNVGRWLPHLFDVGLKVDFLLFG